MPARRVDEKRSERRVVARIPSALYVRLYSTKLYTGLSLEKLMEEGITLVVARYKLQRETQRETDQEPGEE